MKKWILLLLCLPTLMQAQNTEELERQAVIKTIDALFDAMRAGDSTALKATFMPEAKLMTTYTDKQGVARVHTSTAQDFANSVGTPHDEILR